MIDERNRWLQIGIVREHHAHGTGIKTGTLVHQETMPRDTVIDVFLQFIWKIAWIFPSEFPTVDVVAQAEHLFA